MASPGSRLHHRYLKRGLADPDLRTGRRQAFNGCLRLRRRLGLRLLGLLGLVRPEGGDLDDIVVKMDVGETEPAADQPAVAEGLLDLVGRRIGRDIEVLGLAAQKQIAHAPAHEVGVISLLLQTVKHPDCVGTDPLAGDGMFPAGDDLWLN